MKNTYRTDGQITYIKLPSGGSVQIDTEDLHRAQAAISQHAMWDTRTHLGGRVGGGPNQKTLLAKVVVDTISHVRIRHINGDVLDCRKANLASGDYVFGNIRVGNPCTGHCEALCAPRMGFAFQGDRMAGDHKCEPATPFYSPESIDQAAAIRAQEAYEAAHQAAGTARVPGTPWPWEVSKDAE